MKKFETKLGDYFKLPNPGLRAYFKHTESGNSDDYRPPFWDKVDRQIVLNKWLKHVESLRNDSRFSTLYEYELEMKDKVGPLSIQLPLDKRIESIEQYYTCVERPGEPISATAIAQTIKFFSKAGGLRLKSRLNVLENMRLNTNSGVWLFTKRKKVVQDTLPFDIDASDMSVPRAFSLKPEFSRESWDLAAVLGWRGQEGGMSAEDVKQRVIWMMPFLLNIDELTFYQPAVTAVQKYDLIPAYISMDRVDQEVTALFDTKNPNDVVICTDFTKFDQHFNKHLQDAAYKVISSLFSKGNRNDRQSSDAWLQCIFPIKYNIPLICSENLMYSGPHGMGSGSGGTNFDECLAHKSLQFEAAEDNHAKLNPHSMAYGDDGILTYPGITVDQVIQAYTRHGLEMNETKQYVSKHNCVVLRRWYGDNYRINGTMVGVYSTFRALGRLLGQERFYDAEKWSGEMVTLRALSILENCKWHPLFHEFIEFVKKGDRYKLGLAIPGFFDNIVELAKNAIEEFTDFLGYTKTLQEETKSSVHGIINWEVVKYLRKQVGSVPQHTPRKYPLRIKNWEGYGSKKLRD